MRIINLAVSISAIALIATGATAQGDAPAAPQASTAATAVVPAQDPKEIARAAKAEQARQKNLIKQFGMGPYPEEIDGYLADKPEALKPYYKLLIAGGERNAVLNFQRLGLAAINVGEFDRAEWAFDKALDRIETIYAKNPQADAARSLFHNEANKDYKGEPYERSMAYYYRGLLYLRKGDYGNARAVFKQAEFQDTLSDAETFQSDFAVMNYMIGWTYHCEGQASSASESFGIAAKAQPGLNAPAPGDTLLIVSELGNGPVKARDGAQSQKLVFQAGPAYPESAAVAAVAFPTAAAAPLKKGAKAIAAPSPYSVNLMQASSVYYQATTRGGRAIDGVMNGKANWKGGTDTAGDVVGKVGEMSGDSTMQLIGLGMKLFSSTMKTNADIRAWDGLPDLIMVGTGKTGPNFGFDMSYRKGTEPLTISGGPVMKGGNAACNIAWSRSRPIVLPSDAVPGEDVGVARAVSRKAGVAQKDRAFRTALTGQEYVLGAQASAAR
ncbi:MAG: hypothetical protein ABW039_12270 [Sphingobium sp.]